jgi:MFS family permease
LGLGRIILGAIAGFILVSIIYLFEIFTYIPDEGVRGIFIILIGGFIAGLVVKSPLSGVIAGALSVLIVPSLEKLSEIESVESYVKWLWDIQLGEGLKYFLAGAVGGYVGGYLMKRLKRDEIPQFE